MVSVHLELSDEAHARLLAEAEERGMSLQSYLTGSLTQSPGAPSYFGLLDHQMESAADPKDVLGTIQDAYRQCLEIMHHDMVSIQTELIGLQREVVRRSLQSVQTSGLTAEHHFYVAFRTDAPDVLLGEDLKAQHPETMTIVLEHQFSQLEVDDKGFSVSLWFGGVPRRIGVPFDALVAFFDPSSELQLTFPDLQPRRPAAAPRAQAAAAAEPNALPITDMDNSTEGTEPLLESSDADGGDPSTTEARPPADDEAASTTASSGDDSSGNVLSFDAFLKK